MMKRKLGKSEIEITAIGLGVWQFSEAQGFHKLFWKAIDAQTRTEIVHTSIKGGVNWFDTAEVYGNGRSERGLRDSLQEIGAKDPDILIATKWNPIMRRAKSIGKTIGKRLENLSPYPVTLHQIHNPASFSKPETEMIEMAKLLRDGKVKSVGVSNFNTDKTIRAYETLEKEGFPLVSNQVRYSILDRRPEKKLIDKAKELGITIIAYSPLAQGLATGRFHQDPETINSLPFMRKRRFKRKFESATDLIKEMELIAKLHEKTVSQVALNWLINFHGETVMAIPGASKPSQAEMNAGAMNFELTKTELDSLDDLSRQFI